MQRLIVVLGLLLITNICLGQNSQLDSLKQLLHTTVNEQQRLQYLIAFCKPMENMPNDTAWQYATQARQLAAKLKDPQAYTLATVALAEAYLSWDNVDSAKALLAPEIPKYTVADPATRATYFKLMGAHKDVIAKENDYKAAMALTYNLLAEAERYKDSIAMAENMNSLGAWYYDLDRVPESTPWFYKALAVTTSAPKFNTIRETIYLNLSDNYWWTGKQDSAAYCINKSFTISIPGDDIFYESVGWQLMSSVLSKQNKYEEAREAILKSIAIGQRIYGNQPQQDKLMVLATVYNNMKQYGNAIKVLKDGLRQDSIYKVNSPHAGKQQLQGDLGRSFYYDELAHSYKLAGDLPNTVTTLENMLNEKDSFYKANSATALAAVQAKYEFQKQQTTIAEQKLAINRRNYLLTASFIILALSGIIAWLLMKDIRRRQKTKLQQVQADNAKAVAAAEETERKRIAADLHDNLGAQLSFIKRNVDFIMEHPAGFSEEDERKYLGYVNDTARNAMVDLRETLWVLNKDGADIQEFADKLKSYLQQQLAGSDAIQWEFTETITTSWKLATSDIMHLFRIVQECVSNVVKHAGADVLTVQLESRKTNSYKLMLSDNGHGFNPQEVKEGHYGMENIRQRAGALQAGLNITSNTAGTVITLHK